MLGAPGVRGAGSGLYPLMSPLPTAPARKTGELCPTQVQARGDQRPQRTAQNAAPPNLKLLSCPQRKTQGSWKKGRSTNSCRWRRDEKTPRLRVLRQRRAEVCPTRGRERAPSFFDLSQVPGQVHCRGGGAGRAGHRDGPAPRLSLVASWGDPSRHPMERWQPATLGWVVPSPSYLLIY